jgi:hypothetical protein
MNRSVLLAPSLTIVLLLAPAWAQQSNTVETAYVYKPDGTHHRDADPGVPLAAMAQELIDSGIPVYSRRKAHDGREGIAVCASPTGSINLYEVAESDLPKAFQLGFRRLDPSWLERR